MTESPAKVIWKNTQTSWFSNWTESHRSYFLEFFPRKQLSSRYARLNLIHDQQIDDPQIRSKTAALLARMFAVKGSTLASNFHQLFTTFLGRFNDRATEIRIIMVEFAKHYLIYQDTHLKDINGMVFVLSNVTVCRSVEQPCQRHWRRSSCQGRGCRVWCREREAYRNIGRFDENCGRATPRQKGFTSGTLFLRLQESVRKEASQKLAELYVALSEKWQVDATNWDEENVSKFAWIPSKILLGYFIDAKDRWIRVDVCT